MKRKKSKKVWAAIAVLIAVPVAANVASIFMAKRYTAEMRLLVSESSPNAPQPQSAFPGIDDIQNEAGPRTTQTQLDILTGTEVLEGAIKMAADRLPNKIKTDADMADLYENLLRKMTVDNELNSDTLTVKVTQADPEVAAELANDIGLSYTDFLKRLATESGSQEQLALQKVINNAKTTLVQVDEKIRKLKDSSHVLDVNTSATAVAQEKASAEQKLAEAEGNYQGAQAQLAVAEGDLKSVPKTIPIGTRTQTNPVLLSVEQTLAQEETSLDDLKAKYYDDFPDVKRQQDRVNSLKKQVNHIKSTIDPEHTEGPNPVYQGQQTAVMTLRSQVQLYGCEVEGLKAELATANQQANDIPVAEQKLQGLMRDRTVAEQNYEQLQQKEAQVEALGMARQPSARIVSTALPPTLPSFPDSKILTMAGLAVGGFLAVLILMPRAEAPIVADQAPATVSVEPLPEAPEVPEELPEQKVAASIPEEVPRPRQVSYITLAPKEGFTENGSTPALRNSEARTHPILTSEELEALTLFDAV